MGSHPLLAKDGSGRKTVFNFFGRLEYQVGKRRRYVNQEEAATQFYHGRGTVHLHLLVWLQHVESIQLEEVVSATVPADNLVQESLVEGSQRSWTGSGWPKEPKASYYDAEAGVLHLQHKEEDWCKHNRAGVPEGIRAYMPDLLNSLHCHIDVQASDAENAPEVRVWVRPKILRFVYNGLAQRSVLGLCYRKTRAYGLSPIGAGDGAAACDAMVPAVFCRWHLATLPRACAMGRTVPRKSPAVHAQPLESRGHVPGGVSAQDQQEGADSELHQEGI